jgi:hypothetical protein
MRKRRIIDMSKNKNPVKRPNAMPTLIRSSVKNKSIAEIIKTKMFSLCLKKFIFSVVGVVVLSIELGCC